jgi:hypothetical protein
MLVQYFLTNPEFQILFWAFPPIVKISSLHLETFLMLTFIDGELVQLR